jgi:hypothetical protein
MADSKANKTVVVMGDGDCDSNCLQQRQWQLATATLTATGMVHANVGHKVMLITLSKGYFCTNFYIQWSRDVTSPSTTAQTTNKHHHHGDGAACPSSRVDLMIPCHPNGGRPWAFIFQGHCQGFSSIQ